MKRSDIRCERLSKKDSLAAAKLLSLDAYTGPDLLQVLEEEPELFSAAYVDETLLALVQMEASVPQSHLNVFVAPQYRRQGIGRALMQMAEAQLQAGGTRKVSTSVRSGASSSLAFARSLGYAPYYSLIYMERTGVLFLRRHPLQGCIEMRTLWLPIRCMLLLFMKCGCALAASPILCLQSLMKADEQPGQRMHRTGWSMSLTGKLRLTATSTGMKSAVLVYVLTFRDAESDEPS